MPLVDTSISDGVSQRIERLRFLLIFGVILIHAYTSGTDYSNIAPSHLYVQNLIAFFFGEVAVPFFFLISGFLLYSTLTFSWKDYTTKVRSRVRTLAIPYLLWNAIAYLPHLARAIRDGSWLADGTSGSAILSAMWQHLDAAFGLTHAMPAAYQFWFVKTLFVLVVLSPVIQLSVRRLGWRYILALLALLVLNAVTIGGGTAKGLFYVSAGVFIRNRLGAPDWSDKTGRRILGVYLAFCLGMDLFFPGSKAVLALREVNTILGIAALWYLAGTISRYPALSRLLIRLGGVSFFVFAVHEPLVRIANRALYGALAPVHLIEALAIYVTVSLSVATIACLGGFLLQRRLPRVYRILTGSR